MDIHRNIEQSIQSALKSFSVVALTGPRQTGKSTLLKTLFGNEYSYTTFDDPLVRERAMDDPVFFLDNLGDRAIIDEIQYVPQIFRFLHPGRPRHLLWPGGGD
ncbi:MAG: AAA family ATPase [Bacteroidales bacterium]|nr:AAA family ATPase [Bacteroidales bacterium]